MKNLKNSGFDVESTIFMILQFFYVILACYALIDFNIAFINAMNDLWATLVTLSIWIVSSLVICGLNILFAKFASRNRGSMDKGGSHLASLAFSSVVALALGILFIFISFVY